MSTVQSGLKYTKEHEWVVLDSDNIATIGITDFAQQSLGDITYVQLPKVNEQLKKDDPFGIVESVKAVSDLYAPVTGRVVEVNEPLLNAPELINEDPYNDGWLIKVEVKEEDEGDYEELLSDKDYKDYLEEKG